MSWGWRWGVLGPQGVALWGHQPHSHWLGADLVYPGLSLLASLPRWDLGRDLCLSCSSVYGVSARVPPRGMVVMVRRNVPSRDDAVINRVTGVSSP